MDDQGKRLMFAVAIAFGIMLAWTAIFPSEKPEEKPEVSSEASGDAGALAPGDTVILDSDGVEIVDAATPTPVVSAPVIKRGDEQLYTFEFENLRATFSSYDGALRSWELLGKRLVDRKKNVPEDLVRIPGEKYPMLRVWYSDSTFDVPAGSEWRGEKVSERELHFTWESSDFRVVKKIVLHPEEFSMSITVVTELLGADRAKQAVAITLYSQEDPDASGGGGMFSQVSRAWDSACFYDDEIHTRGSGSLAKNGEKKRTGPIYWGGFSHPYFLASASFKGGGDKRIDCNAYPVAGVEGGMQLDLIEDKTDVKKGPKPPSSSLWIYLGPKYRGTLRDANALAGSETMIEESVDLGFLAIIAGPLLSLLNFFQGFVINWGLAIILLTIVVKGLTLPWTHKSMKSMKAMAKLKPQLEKIKEKYKDDRQRQNLETMNLFKANKVNPMSGCLPMLLQMPIWFALYRSLTVAGELYQAHFIPGWIDDLTLADPYYIMPIMLTGMMFLQTRLTPSTGTGAQQKILMYGMPIMFGVFSFFFPAGLTLYIFTNTCFTALHHLYMHKTEAAAGAAGAAKIAEATKMEPILSNDKPAKESEDSSSDSSDSSTPKSGNKPGAAKKKSKNKKRKK